MSLVSEIKNLIGKRAACSHDEGQHTAHSVIGSIESIDEDVLVIVTDFGVRHIIPVARILKIKELKNELVGEKNAEQSD